MEETTQTQEQQLTANPFDEGSWTESAAGQDASTLQSPEGEENKKVLTTQEQEEIVDANTYLEKELGFKDWESAKTEIDELRKSKNAAPKEFEFANETSKAFFDYVKEGKEDELYTFLNEKKKVERLVSGEVNENTAAEIIKFGMQQKYKDLTPDEIDYKYNKQFALPPEPTQTFEETDDEFAERKNEWSEKLSDAKKELMIEAKLIKPELDKYKAELVLPNISQKAEVNNVPTQEELAAGKKFSENYLQNVETFMKSFDGFSMEYKDEDVAIPLNYALSEDEKKNVAEKLNSLAENDFNANAIFAQRWVNEDNTLNVAQIAKDVAKLESEDRVSQKFVNDAVNKRLVEYRKKVSNINVDGGNSQKTFAPEGEKNDTQKMQDFFWSN
jgi:hypothetical protein